MLLCPRPVAQNAGSCRNLYLQHNADLDFHRLQYYGQRGKLKMVGSEDDPEKLNRTVLQMAEDVVVAHVL